jgi:hypothetical protein
MGICSKKTNPLLGSRKTSHTFIAEHISNQTEYVVLNLCSDAVDENRSLSLS